MRILLIDDDELLTQILANNLTAQHYAIDVAIDGITGLNYAQAATYDLIVLDVNLPRLDGIRLCQQLRQNRYTGPILLLTAKGDSSDKVMGLDAGADDYVVKPCSVEELSARIRALLRRQGGLGDPVLEWGDLRLDPGAREVSHRGHPIFLSPKEYGLLELFLRYPQRTFNSSIILEHLWGFDDAPGEETIRTHVKRLRQKMKAAGVDEILDTVYGMGYRLKPPPTPALTAPTDSVPAPTLKSIADEARSVVLGHWEEFRPACLERVAVLDQAIAALEADSLPEDLCKAAENAAHKLAGSLAMFGFPGGTRLGREIEQWFQQEPAQRQLDQVRSLVEALHQELEGPPQVWDDPPEPAQVSVTAMPQPSWEASLQESLAEVKLSEIKLPEIKVLVVDDDVLVLDRLKQVLPAWGIQPITLEDPRQVWKMLAAIVPDLVILDVDMGQINGIELCRKIRDDHAWNGLPILFLTASRDTDTVIRLYTAGADDYVAKPFTEPEIVTRIFNRLQRNRALRGLA